MKPFGEVRAGILGGGQLGRMLVQEAINLNIAFDILDPDPEAPCKSLSPRFVTGSLSDFDTVYNFGKDLDLITIEIEKVNADALGKLEEEGVLVYPQPRVIQLIQDKGLQKEFFRQNDIPSAPFRLFKSRDELLRANPAFPFIQKLRRDGYDGRGVLRIASAADLDHAFNEPSLIEELVDFEKELSVIVARSSNGETRSFPCVEMEFNPEANLVEFLVSPSAISNEIQKEAEQLAKQIASALNITGLLAVEMFLTKNGSLLVNEIAPRPHNSGHQSIEGNATSQFGQHLRAIFGLPLGDPSAISHAVMVNLLGEPGYSGPARYEGMEELLKMSGVHVHLYGKLLTKPFRKMGHITVIDTNREKALEKARAVQQLIKVKA
jgi:5-(carboxyamino)imidazole ribonucleotide synthase